MILFGYDKWSTVKKAKSFLEDKKIEYRYIDAKKDVLEKEEIKVWYDKAKVDIKKIFNTSGNVYKEMDLKNKLDKLNLDEKLELLAGNGMLVKRPILVFDNAVLIGFKEKEWEEALS